MAYESEQRVAKLAIKPGCVRWSLEQEVIYLPWVAWVDWRLRRRSSRRWSRWWQQSSSWERSSPYETTDAAAAAGGDAEPAPGCGRVTTRLPWGRHDHDPRDQWPPCSVVWWREIFASSSRWRSSPAERTGIGTLASRTPSKQSQCLC